MKKLVLFSIIVGVSLSFITTFCTENSRAKNWGGDMVIEVPSGMKVTNITWKKSQLWYSYRPFEADEEPTTQTFVEQSSWGIMEGSVTFKESK